ncbi:MAG: 4-hydroxybenzoate octaprenyltransferase [Agarilytica sp.]
MMKLSPAKKDKFVLYGELMRLHRPIGIYLVVWPTLWALWLAAKGLPDLEVLVIFLLGAVLMRSAGCVINDYADRNVDGHVRRTKERPIVSGRVTPKEALILFACLCAFAFGLVLLTNTLTIWLSLGALALASAYPFMKRYTHLPQVVLGAAFAWAVPMAFAAQTGEIDPAIWLVYTTVVIWTVCYDTFYAMADREDDLKIGVRSTAILFGDMDKVATGSLQIITLISLFMIKQRFELGDVYLASLIVVAALFAYQQYLIKDREPQRCLAAFLNNNWVGMIIFLGIIGDYAAQSL